MSLLAAPNMHENNKYRKQTGKRKTIKKTDHLFFFTFFSIFKIIYDLFIILASHSFLAFGWWISEFWTKISNYSNYSNYEK